MSSDPPAATRVRRILAVFLDTVVFFALWTAVGAVFAQGSLFYTVALFFVLDVGLTAFLGVSLGRWITGIRVEKADGSRPGLVAALIRTVLTFLTGWVGLFVFTWTAWLGFGKLTRLWWDAAAGTRLVLARSQPAS